METTAAWMITSFALVLAGLSIIVLVYLMVRTVFPAVIYGGNYSKRQEERHRTVEEVRTSGELIASDSFAGKLGGIYIQGPLMIAQLYPKGIVLSGPLISPCALHWEQATHVVFHDGNWFSRRFEIQHRSKDISGSKILNGLGDCTRFGQELEPLVVENRLRVSH